MSHCWVCLVCLAYTVLKRPFWGISVRCLFPDKEQFVMDLYAMKMNTRSWGSCGSGSRPGQPPASQSILGWGSIWVWMTRCWGTEEKRCMTVWLRLVRKSALKAQMCYVSTGTFTMFILAFGLGLPQHWKTPPVVHQCTNMHAADLHHHHPLTLLLARWTNAQQIGLIHQERWREWMKSGILNIWPTDSMTGLTKKIISSRDHFQSRVHNKHSFLSLLIIETTLVVTWRRMPFY